MHQGLARPKEAAESVPSPHLPVGALVGGRYQIVQWLAAGSMGEVYLVEHTELARPMAMKVLLPSLARTPQFVQRFRVEAAAVSRIAHPNIVAITDMGALDDGGLFMVMEYLEGVTLSQLVRQRGALPVTRVLALGTQIARALAAAHGQDVIHRDVKPDNVMLVRKDGRELAKVLDFGVARVETHEGSLGHTRTGMVLGTPRYMSPEQVQARPIDPRTDVYSLGLLLHEALTGAPVFKGKSHAIVMWQQVKDSPPPLPDTVPFALTELVRQMLEKDPALRPEKMAIIADRLEALSRQLPPYIVDRVDSIDAMPLVFAKVDEASVGTVVRGSDEIADTDPGKTPIRQGHAPRVVEPSPTSVGFDATRTELELRIDEGLLRPASSEGAITGPSDVDRSRTVPELIAVARPRSRVAGVAVALIVLAAAGAIAWAALGGLASPPPPLVQVTVDSIPSGAEVREGGALLGTTPLTIVRSARSLATLELTRDGATVRRTIAIREPATKVEVDLR